MAIDCSKCPLDQEECIQLCTEAGLRHPLPIMRGEAGHYPIQYAILSANNIDKKCSIDDHNVLVRAHGKLVDMYDTLLASHNKLVEHHNKLCKALGIGEDAGLDILSKKLETLTANPAVIQIRDSVINKSFMDDKKQ